MTKVAKQLPKGTSGQQLCCDYTVVLHIMVQTTTAITVKPNIIIQTITLLLKLVIVMKTQKQIHYQ